MRADVLSAYPAVDPAKVHVIYNGIDSEQYAPDPPPMSSSATAST